MSDTILTPAQVEQYREQGYLVVRGLLAPEEVKAFLDAAARPQPREWTDLGLRRHTADPHWEAIAKHPTITGIVKQLLAGVPRIVQTMYLAKPPEGGAGIALHQDSHYLRNEPNTLMACWVALSDTDGENGGLCVVSGSHRRPLYRTAPPADTGEHVSWVQVYRMRDREGNEWDEQMHSHEITGLDPGEIVRLAVPAGAGVFFTGMTIHGSFANRSAARPRLAFATHYVREGTWLYRTDVQETVPVETGGRG